MKKSIAVLVKSCDIENQLPTEYRVHTHKTTNRDFHARYDQNIFDAESQFNSKRDNLSRNFKNVLGKQQDISYLGEHDKYIYDKPKRSFTDIEVGKVKALHKKKVKRIYLHRTENRGVGNSDSSSFINQRNQYNRRVSYYDNKRTTSKCVGEIRENADEIMVNKKPLMLTISNIITPKLPAGIKNNTNNKNNTFDKQLVSTATQFEELIVIKNLEEDSRFSTILRSDSQYRAVPKAKDRIEHEIPTTSTNFLNKRMGEAAETVYSSDSLVQHVHNLDLDSCTDKSISIFVDPLENKLEKEYRKIFATKTRENCPSIEKRISDLNSASLLQLRFQALRRGIVKKQDSKTIARIASTEISQNSIPIRKDVSITSDPPSLEGRSCYNMKTYSPIQCSVNEEKVFKNPKETYKKSFVSKTVRESIQLPRKRQDDNEVQGVKEMFKLWGKTFNFEEDNNKKNIFLDSTCNTINKNKESTTQKMLSKEELKQRKEGTIFFFFKKKNKDKTKQPYKSKKGVTAGRCEVRDGLTNNIGATNAVAMRETEENKACDNIPEDNKEILNNIWLKKYLTEKIESRNSVQIRWNNKTYTRSSSTVFELMESIYRKTGLVLKSQSNIITGESSQRPFNKHVNFTGNVQAWMISKMIPDRQTNGFSQSLSKNNNKNNIQITDQKWFKNKFKAFAHKIEIVLHSKKSFIPNKVQYSDYSQTEIPTSFILNSTSDSGERPQTINEEVYRIVEYESLDPETGNNFETDNYAHDVIVTENSKDSKEIKTKVFETSNKKSPIYKDVIIQDSNDKFSKKNNVIGVGIFSQKDIRESEKLILKIPDDYSDEYSTQFNQLKCEFAKKYLQDYYRLCSLGTDYFRSCIRNPPGSCSDMSHFSIIYQKSGSKSCSNMYNEYQGSTQVSCLNSSCSHCQSYLEETKTDDNFTCKLFNIIKRKCKLESSQNKRVLPKDSGEVFKKRQLYAASNKSKWSTYVYEKPHSVPSIEDEEAQNILIESPKSIKAKSKNKSCSKHISFLNCDAIMESQANQPESILTFKGSSCASCKKKGSKCLKHTKVNPVPSCEIPQQKCKSSCEKIKNPACLKPRAQSGNVPIKTYPIPSSPLPTSHNPCSIIVPPCSNPTCLPTPPKCLLPLPSKSRPLKSQYCTKAISSKTTNMSFPPSNTSISSPIRLSGLPSKTSSGQHSPPCPSSSPIYIPSDLPLQQSTQKKIKKEISLAKCPCNQCMKFPWPMKNQISNQPSLEPCTFANDKSSTLKKCFSIEKSNKTCKPNCINKFNGDPSSSKSKTRMSGIFLKMKASVKNCFSNENCSQSQSLQCIRLNSKEKTFMKEKKETPSNEEIREDLNIKVQDADGQTLFERRDYISQQSSIHKPSVLDDMYKDSCINRLTTANVQLEENTNVELEEKSAANVGEVKNDESEVDFIEINFKIQVAEGNKTTEINISRDNNDEIKQPEIKNQMDQIEQKIFTLKDDACNEYSNEKKKINIRIVIKNFKQKSNKQRKEKFNINDKFSKKISEKFHSVSTGYSGVFDQNDVYSVHKTTIDLTSSTHNSKTPSKSSEEIMIQELFEKPIIALVANKENESIKKKYSKKNTNNTTVDIQSSFSNKENFNLESESYKEDEETYEDKSEMHTCDMEIDDYLDGNTFKKNEHQNINDKSTGELICKPLNKENKKELLKKIFEIASVSKSNNKDRMKQLKLILSSDSSSYKEMAESSNKLVKDITYASLKSKYSRDRDIMNNHYKMGTASKSESIINAIYQAEDHSTDSTNIDSSGDDNKKTKCLCRTVASRLNACKESIIPNGCCCRGKLKIFKVNKETNCDLRTDVNLFLLNYKTAQTIDVETQTLKVRSKEYTRNISKQNVKVNYFANDLGYSEMNVDKTLQKSIYYTNHIKENTIKERNTNPTSKIFDHEKIIVIGKYDVCIQTSIMKCRRDKKDKYRNNIKTSLPEDFLQSNEIKKAVLDIYTEKTMSLKGREGFVAKLPKFVCDNESDIERKYSKMLL